MTIAIDSTYGTEAPYAVSTNSPNAHWTDTVVSQGHADYCEAYGHAAFTVESTGKQSERCGRCGDLLEGTEETPAVEDDITTYAFTNQRDAVRFAQAQGGPIEVQVDHVARGEWVVSIVSKPAPAPAVEPACDINPGFESLLQQMAALTWVPLDARERFDAMLRENFTGEVNEEPASFRDTLLRAALTGGQR